MDETEKLALVIPALQEAQNLGELLTRVRSALSGAAIDWEVIVVDDNSRDGTEEIVREMSQEDARVRLLVRRGERGLSGAILHGWRHADASILGVMDADGQHPPESLPGLISAILKGSDLAIASRYARGRRCNWGSIRRLLSLSATIAARPLNNSGPRVYDPLSGFFLVRRGCVENVIFQRAGFKLLLEVLVRGRIRSVVEVPFAFERRRAGRSKVCPRVVGSYLALLAKLYAGRYGLIRAARKTSGDQGFSIPSAPRQPET